MKKKARVKQQRAFRAMLAKRYAVGLALAFGAGLAVAEDEDATIFEGPEDAGNNWIEIGAGGMTTFGNRAQAEQNRRLSQGVYGGITDLHFEKQIAKATMFTLDGRGLAGENDYSLSFGIEKEESYFLRFHFENFRTWSNGDGGYYSPGNAYYPLRGDALALDRGEFSVEGGFTLNSGPGLRFKYSHLYRDGDKGSTIWGPTHPGLINPTTGIVPTVSSLDEERHIFELDLTHRIKSTDLNLGAIYEFGDLNNARKMSRFPGEGLAAGERKVTHRENTSYDLFNVHASSETWLKPNLFFSAGFMFSDLDNDTSGQRIWGDNYDVVFAPNAANGQGFTNLLSNARKHDYVLNLNLMSQPTRTLTVTPSIRVHRQDWDAYSSAFSTFGNNLFGATASAAEADALEVRERLDIRYGGITNWVFTVHGEWTQGEGDQMEYGGLFNAANAPGSPLTRETEETRFAQKYSVSAKWYPARRLSVEAGAYYKRSEYDYDHTIDNTANAGANRYPAYLTLQNFETYDGNARITWRPLGNVTLVGRYEYQLSYINTTPDPVSGLSEAESAEMTSHIVALNASWTPWSRMYVQAGVHYVNSELHTPAVNYTTALLDSQNNYWSANGNVGFVLDEKTDLNLGYSYYRADDYSDIAPAGLALGSGAEEHGITATLVHRINKNLRASLRYGFYTYTDDSFGEYRDYDAHVVYTGLQYRF